MGGRDEIFKLQHNIYVDLIKIELVGTDKELTNLNSRPAKLRRNLKVDF